MTTLELRLNHGAQIVRKRYFIVRRANGDYATREVDREVADSIQRFGTTIGTCECQPGEHWVFYFMNMHLAPDEANRIAHELALRIDAPHEP